MHVNGLKNISAAVGIIGAIALGIWAIEARYAKAENVFRQIQAVERLYLESERRHLKQQEFDLEERERKGGLSDFGRKRLREVRDEIDRLERQIKERKR